MSKDERHLNRGISSFVEAPCLNLRGRTRHLIGLRSIGQVQGPK
jgi:hypothetical protein